jgi:PAS domain S-box-containing protein
VENVINDLRALYRSSRKMAGSHDVNAILDFLVDDLIDNTELDRIMILRLDRKTRVLAAQVSYGYQNVTEYNNYRFCFDEVNGLLRKVYNDREPLNVIDFVDDKKADVSPVQKCGILKDSFRNSKEPNRRARVNLCVPELSSSHQIYSSQSSQYQHYTIMHMDRYDKTINHLLGDVPSFLILPICDEKSFYGYVLADKSLSEQEINYGEIRLAVSMVNHAACSVGRALGQKKMLDKIAAQLEEIQELKSFYQSIIQNLRSGLITVNQFMEITECNKAAEMLLGYHEEELRGKPLDTLFVDKDGGNKCRYVDTADEIDTCMGALAEIPMLKKGGEIIATEVCFSVIQDNNNDISGLSCIFRDISARKTLEQNLARVDKLASLGELAAGMAHEIKNPLAGIAGAMQIMAKNYHSESPYHFVFSEVQEQVKKLDSFVNGLLQFARPGQTHFSDVDIEEVLEKVLFLVMGQLDKKKISVTKMYGEKSMYGEKASMVQGDSGQLQQVLLNIVLNAIDAMEVGGALTLQIQLTAATAVAPVLQACVKARCFQKTAMLNISISDTGYGIEADSLDKIFNPFHTTKCKGTGLGLSISHRIIEQHGGVILVKSTPGVGSTFTVSLPVCGVSAASRRDDTLLQNKSV